MEVKSEQSGLRKRPRVDSDSVATHSDDHEFVDGVSARNRETSMDMDERFWFADGNIVFMAEGVAFRVHASIVGRDSVTLRDMVKNVIDTKSVQQMEGCPSVALSDTAMDFKTLLSVLYAGVDSFGTEHRQVPFADVASLIRLAHKYQITQLRDDALTRLKTCFPSSYSTANFECFKEYRSPVLVMESVDDAISAVNLARLTHTHSILPTALYICTIYVMNDTVLRGLRRRDGTVEQLSPEDVLRSFEAVDSLLDIRNDVALELWKLRRDPDCIQHGKCSKIIRSLPQLAFEHGSMVSYDALGPLVSDLTQVKDDLCDACSSMVLEIDEKQRRKVFHQLPTIMGVADEVGDWDITYDHEDV